MLYLAIEKEDVLSPEASVLHFAPELAVSQFIRERVGTYVTADLDHTRGDLVLDLEKIDLPNGSFGVVIANHVLEHVDDRAALRELERILRPDGVLIITVPLIEGWEMTYEEPCINTPAERELHFGQSDHVRYYGRDFRERLKAARLVVSEFTAPGDDAVRFGLLRGERIFFARKA